jgi:hypothetical protein
MGYSPKCVALRVTALWIWVEDALGRKRVVKKDIYLRITCRSSCDGDVASAQVDPYVKGNPRTVISNPDRGEHWRIWIVRRMSQLENVLYKLQVTWQYLL